MLARRPFASQTALVAAARAVWDGLTPDDWREAFRHHPKIGDRTPLAGGFAAAADLSAREQEGMHGTSDHTLAELAAANALYEARFGYIFIVCATGKNAGEMLALLRSRLSNDAETEMRIAAEEQARITALRLAGLGAD
jgi:2-oxo-4-hydroxy-4-carboxy-5-ureidoimidazoline decarboxylase